jgi:putative ABC transport system permease protein
MSADASGLRVAWRALTRAQLREQPLRVLTTVVAIALGVALGSSVYLVNSAALDEFDQATRRLVGDTDILVRGPVDGFDEALYPALARYAGVSSASPVLELDVTLPGRHSSLKILALDPFRAAALQPALMGEISSDITALFAHDAVVLSRAAAQQLQLQRGDTLPIVVGGSIRTLRVIDVLSGNAYPEPLGLMDLGAAQWTLARLGRLNRIDLRVQPGISTRSLRAALARALPAGVVALTPELERGRAASATRAYRVNLNMLALVALLTGAFLVFSTQSLSVLRRRTALGLLRSLGVTRTELHCALLAEGAAIGAAGSLLGVLLGALTASLALRYLGTDLGNRQLSGMGASVVLQPLPVILALLIGTAIACLGAWIPALEAARRSPALALKSGDAEPVLSQLSTTLPAVALIATGAMLAWLPPVGGLPLPGYLAIADLLGGSILLVPALMQGVAGALPRSGWVELDTAVAQLQGSAGLATVGLASIIVSFSLMVAMAIMVHSFRQSFELWLVKLLPADIQLRISTGSDTGAFTFDQQQRIASLPGVLRADFRHIGQLWLRPDHAPVTLIARAITLASAADTLPLVGEARSAPPVGAEPAWISEAVQDLYGYRTGELISVPLAGAPHAFYIAGVWRDYVHPGGAVVIARANYIAVSGDRSASEASVWRRPQASLAALQAALRSTLSLGEGLDLTSTPQLRERSLMLFDRAFAITYALEAIAVIIGLVGVAVAGSSTALARRAQFGMLRHVGMLRRQVLAMLASEGVIISTLAVLYGLLLGTLLSLILVYVINRQSFSWSIDLAVPWRQLAVLSVLLIVASAFTALWSGRTAMGLQAIRAVREDW